MHILTDMYESLKDFHQTHPRYILSLFYEIKYSTSHKNENFKLFNQCNSSVNFIMDFPCAVEL